MKKTIIFGGICAVIATCLAASEANSATTIGSFVIPKPVNGCSPTVVVGEKDLTTGCYTLTTTQQSLVNGVCTPGTSVSRNVCDGTPGAGITYRGIRDNCDALNSLTGLSQGDAYYVNGKLYIYDGSSFPSCPENGVNYQGPAGLDGCTPRFTIGSKNTSGCATLTITPSSLVNGTCTDGTPQTGEWCDGATGPQGPQGPDMCEGATSPSTTLKNEVKTYTAHTATEPGHMSITSTMCNNSTVSQTQQDACSAVDESHMPTTQRVCQSGQFTECVNQQTNQTYTICWTASTQNTQTLSTAIQSAQTTADNAQATATTTANKVDNATTGLAAAHAAAAAAQNAADNAQTTADGKISKTATFSKSNGYVVLTDGNTTMNVVALEDIKGDKGDDGKDACQSLSLVTDDSYSGNDGTRYVLQCND